MEEYLSKQKHKISFDLFAENKLRYFILKKGIKQMFEKFWDKNQICQI